MADSDIEMAWGILKLVFGPDSQFYIDTECPFSDRRRLCIDGTDYSVTDEQLAWLESTFWTEPNDEGTL